MASRLASEGVSDRPRAGVDAVDRGSRRPVRALGESGIGALDQLRVRARPPRAPRLDGSGTPRRVVFVAHEVGGSGGMERQSERLVSGLLEAGHPVTVVARSCSLFGWEGLRFIRVPTPRRPASLGYPAFFAVASLLVARERGDLLHTTGAIIANSADVSTVHYCHRAAVRRVTGSRASRPSPLYRISAAFSKLMFLAGEAWCYRPGRMRQLCAVSRGVAGELRERFPRMAGAIRTVPNGVDRTVFRPDAAARREMRAQLGIDDRVALALFVGGDWERKGLAHAIDALGLSPAWHLAVAGAGDPAPHAARARSAGSEPRLHFLGSVRDTPRLYAAADAFVLPTAYEAFPLVALEAAASGLPLLVTRVNGVEDLLQDGLGGWFVARDARDIARRLTELQAEPDLARRMGAAARSAALRFSWEAMVEGYLALYAELHSTPSP
jgi:glycosyltransferase involved in cell wall biosynthesis